MSADADHVRALLLQQQRKRECLNMAVVSGLQSASISLAVSGGLTYALAQYSGVSDTESHLTCWLTPQPTKWQRC